MADFLLSNNSSSSSRRQRIDERALASRNGEPVLKHVNEDYLDILQKYNIPIQKYIETIEKEDNGDFCDKVELLIRNGRANNATNKIALGEQYRVRLVLLQVLLLKLNYPHEIVYEFIEFYYLNIDRVLHNEIINILRRANVDVYILERYYRRHATTSLEQDRDLAYVSCIKNFPEYKKTHDNIVNQINSPHKLSSQILLRHLQSDIVIQYFSDTSGLLLQDECFWICQHVMRSLMQRRSYLDFYALIEIIDPREVNGGRRSRVAQKWKKGIKKRSVRRRVRRTYAHTTSRKNVRALATTTSVRRWRRRRRHTKSGSALWRAALRDR